MKKIKATVAALLAGAVLILGSGPAYAAEPPAYGACVSEKTGAVRVLEKTNLSKSLYGSCKSTETKVSVASKVVLPVVKSLRQQWVADKAAVLPVKPTTEDYAYKSWLSSTQAPSPVAVQIGEGVQLCTVTYKWVKPKASTTVRAARVPVYSCVEGEVVTRR